jgi:putative transcriptional regulator
MIRNRLSTLMGTQRLTQRELQRRTGLSYTTVNELYHDKAKRLDFATLDKLCRALGVGVGEILEYDDD